MKIIEKIIMDKYLLEYIEVLIVLVMRKEVFFMFVNLV